MNNKKYPISMFVTGFIINLLVRFSWLFIPGAILLIIGIFVDSCFYFGLVILLLDIIASFILQMVYRQIFLKESDNTDLNVLRDTISKEGSWHKNIIELVNQRISDSEHKNQSDDENQ